MASTTLPLSDNFFKLLRTVKLRGLYTMADRRYLIQAFTWFYQHGEHAPRGMIGRYLLEQGCSEPLAEEAERCWESVAEVCAYQKGSVPLLFDPDKLG